VYNTLESKQIMDFQENIAKIFREAREKSGLTQAEVAKKAGIHVNYYARIERGEKIEPRGYIINNIAGALDIKLKLPLEH
jgi:transcriptional regulator with XRE-family HTH domain